jgi:16S rRNA (cytosine967-C5)-methyltransferase
MHADARQTALEILTALELRDVTLDALMEEFHGSATLEDRDVRLVQALVYGVQRWRSRLDRHIDTRQRRAGAKLDPLVRNILRIALFQLLFMDRIPPSAAVDTAVSLVKRSGQRWAAGFVNALLRRVIREDGVMEADPAERDPAQSLALAQSIPLWLAQRWLTRLGASEALALGASINQIPPLSIRANLLKTTRPQLLQSLSPCAARLTPSCYTPEGIRLTGSNAGLFDSRAFQDGEFQIQDEAAQAIGHFLAPQSGERVLDACAGLGGKTAHLAALMNNRGSITAVDRSGGKLKRLAKEMQRLGVDIVQTQIHDWMDDGADWDSGVYDRILLDAPCSGLGVLRRNPDTKWRRTPESIGQFQRTQQALVARLSRALRTGGVMVYAVCSTEPEETHGVVKAFLNNNPEFAIDEAPASMDQDIAPLLADGRFLHAEPHRHGTDGFFAVRFRRLGGAT